MRFVQAKFVHVSMWEREKEREQFKSADTRDGRTKWHWLHNVQSSV